jgi:MSHA biogenesis protein MshQ
VLDGNISFSDLRIKSLNDINNGLGSITFFPVGLGKYGSFKVDLSSGDEFYNWLYDNNTKGIGSFGIYRGRDRIIEWKEIKP